MVSNMDVALDFYVRTLGMKLLDRYGNHYAALDAAGLIIGLHPKSDDATFGNNLSIGLGVSEFDETVSALHQTGISFRITRDYIRLAHFKDPDGNCLFLAENEK